MHAFTTLVLTIATSLAAPTGRVEEEVGREIDRLRSLMEKFGPRSQMGRPPDLGARLDRVAVMLEDGFLAASLEQLVQVRRPVLTASYREALGSGDVDTAALDAIWNEAGREIEERTAPGIPVRSDLPALAQALVQAERVQARDYFKASRVQGEATGTEGGLYYLGVARAHADNARFVQALPFPEPSVPAPALPGLDAFLDEVEEELLALYEPPASLGSHRDFIEASAKLKFARELRGQDFDLAALRQALESWRRIRSLEGNVDAVDGDELSALVDDLRIDLESRDLDHGVALVLLEFAEAALIAGDDSSASPPLAELGALTVNELIPAYLRCTQPAPANRPGAATSVRVTVVRWPFT